jgi:hypothetical protein
MHQQIRLAEALAVDLNELRYFEREFLSEISKSDILYALYDTASVVLHPRIFYAGRQTCFSVCKIGCSFKEGTCCSRKMFFESERYYMKLRTRANFQFGKT